MAEKIIYGTLCFVGFFSSFHFHPSTAFPLKYTNMNRTSCNINLTYHEHERWLTIQTHTLAWHRALHHNAWFILWNYDGDSCCTHSGLISRSFETIINFYVFREVRKSWKFNFILLPNWQWWCFWSVKWFSAVWKQQW